MAFIRASKRRQKRNGTKWRRYSKARAVVAERDGGRCRVCRLPAIHAHHIVFRSQGGTDAPDNLIAVCGNCHHDIHDQRIRVTGTATNLHISYRPAQGWDGPNSAMGQSIASVHEDTAL